MGYPFPMSSSSGSKKRCLLVLESCKNLRQLRQSHAQLVTSGLGRSVFPLSRLLALCASSSSANHQTLLYAWTLFRHIHHPTTICIYNTMLKTLLINHQLLPIIHVYGYMLLNRIYPDNYTLPYVLKACTMMEPSHSHPIGESVHGHGLKFGLASGNFVGNALIAMYCAFGGNLTAARQVFDDMSNWCAVSCTLMISGYGKAGDVENARQLFDETPVRDRGIWGAMISAYVQNNCFKEGLHMFRLMQLQSAIHPDEAVLVTILCACANLGSLDTGIWAHRYIERFRLPLTTRLRTALIDMYAKCGCLDIAKKLFDEMHHRDIVSWNTMISGFAMNGDGNGALDLFSKMENAGVRPDDITFIAVLTSCSHSGMASEGLRVVHRLVTDYNIKPKSGHLGCVVDLLCHGGFLNEAKEILELTVVDSSSIKEVAVAWRALLNACCNLGDTEMAEYAADMVTRIDRHSGAYVLLSNFYAASGKQNDARRVRRRMSDRGIEKVPGCSSVEIDGVGFEFVAGEKTHPWMDQVCGLLQRLNEHSSL